MDTKNYKPIDLKEQAMSIDKLYSLHYFSYSKKFHFEGEKHDFFELVYCDSGEAYIKDNDNDHVLKEGMAFLHAPNSFHTVLPNDKFTNVIIVSFSGTLSELKACAGKAMTFDKYEKSLLKTIIDEGKKAFTDPLNLVYQYELKLTDPLKIGTMQIIKNSLENLVIMIQRKNETLSSLSVVPKTPTRYNTIADSVIRYLTQNIKESITLSNLAKHIGYCETYIKRAFKAAMETSIIQYFNVLKIEKAKQLLSETTFSVSQISEQLGFDSVQYFSRLFKKITFMTPTAYQSSITSGIL